MEASGSGSIYKYCIRLIIKSKPPVIPESLKRKELMYYGLASQGPELSTHMAHWKSVGLILGTILQLKYPHFFRTAPLLKKITSLMAVA